MRSIDQLVSIRARKLGLLLFDARNACRRSVQDCAQAMTIAPEQYQTYENGEKSPSLPELEALAFYLNVPVEHFWGSKTLSDTVAGGQRQTERLVRLRHRIVGTYLRMGRSKTNLTFQQLSEKTGIPEEQLRSYENGEQPVPVAELEILAGALDMRIEEFFDQSGPIGKWRMDQLALGKFLELPADVQEFVCKPINRPYLTLAMRLSDLSVEKLRGIAEGLLEITY